MKNENVTILGGFGESQATVLGNYGIDDEQATVLGGYESGSGQATVLSGYGLGSEQATVLSAQNMNGGQATILGGQNKEHNTVANEQQQRWNPTLTLGLYEHVGDYQITGFIKKSGEAEVYTAEKAGKEYVYKLYSNEFSLKQEIIDKLLGKEIPNVAQMLEFGEVELANRRGEKISKRYEIMPKYKRVAMPLPYSELKRLIDQVAEGLHELHKMDIFHKDIKPANILLDENNNYRIIDFGISTVGEEGQTKYTEGGLTPLYASPELRDGKASPAGDFYSLGITLYEFFTGELPYSELERHDMRVDQLKSIGIKVLESQNIPKEFEKLLHGLTFYNSNKEINKKRWGYEQIKQWLQNPEELEDLNMEALGDSRKKIGKVNEKASVIYQDAYYFNTSDSNKLLKNLLGGKAEKSSEIKIFDSYTLADAMGRFWENGKNEIGRGYLEDFFRKMGGEYKKYATYCREVAEHFENTDDEWEIDVAYWNLIYLIEPNMDKFYWKTSEQGGSGYTCEELGVEFFLKSLKESNGVTKTLKQIIESQLLDMYLKYQVKDTKKVDAIHKLKESWKSIDNREKVAWKIGYLLAGKALFYYHGHHFSTRRELYEYVIEWTNSMTLEETCAVANTFERTVEYRAWVEWEEENK